MNGLNEPKDTSNAACLTTTHISQSHRNSWDLPKNCKIIWSTQRVGTRSIYSISIDDDQTARIDSLPLAQSNSNWRETLKITPFYIVLYFMKYIHSNWLVYFSLYGYAHLFSLVFDPSNGYMYCFLNSSDSVYIRYVIVQRVAPKRLCG